MGVTASLVVTFGSDAEDDALLIAEVDNRDLSDGGLNNGRTQFLPGDTVAYLVYKHKLSTTEHKVSAGSVSAGGSGQCAKNAAGVRCLNVVVTAPGGEIRGQFALIPEPASWALMIAGFGIAGLAIRWRRAVFRT